MNEPRYAKLQDILKAKKKEIRKLEASALGIDMTPKVVIKNYAKPHQRKPGRFVADVAELVKALKDEVNIL
jgi:electron transfer flavoprotein beta subunit